MPPKAKAAIVTIPRNLNPDPMDTSFAPASVPIPVQVVNVSASNSLHDFALLNYFRCYWQFALADCYQT